MTLVLITSNVSPYSAYNWSNMEQIQFDINVLTWRFHRKSLKAMVHSYTPNG
jgi:hypothetical protein